MTGTEPGGKASWSTLRGIVCGDLGTMRCLFGSPEGCDQKREGRIVGKGQGRSICGWFLP